MSERTRELEREIEELSRKVEFLERRVVATENERGKSAAQIPVSPGPSAEDVPYARPFEVDYDPEDGEYYIFAPPGCVLVDGHEVEIADVDTESHTVSLDCLDPDDMPDALYAHVTQDASSTGGYKVEFDDEDTKEGALFNFRVCRFGSSENDGDQYDICTSCVTLGEQHMLHPYEVRWAQGENGGQGAWVIWLPMNTGGNHVYIGRERRPIGNVNAAQTLPAGWYVLDMLPANYSGSLWLNASKAKTAGQTESTFLATTGQGDGSGNMYWYAAIVARIDYDSSTGARRVKQLIDSTVTFGANIGDGGGGGGGVELDGISTNGNAQNQVQVHNWNTGTPESGTTLAQDLHDADGVTAQGTLVERTTGGALNYKKIGTLAQLLGSTVAKSSQKILTGLTWNSSTHKLVISSAMVTIAHGVITSWTDNADAEIDTTPISNIIPS